MWRRYDSGRTIHKNRNAIQALTEIQASHDAKIQALLTAQTAQQKAIEKQNDGIRNSIVVSRTLIESQQRTDEQINKLRQAQEETAEELNILVNIIEKLFPKNGKSN